MIYGSTESDFVKLNPIRVTPHSLRDYPHHSNNLSTNSIRNSPKQSTAIFRLRGSSDGYCTVGRLYEEIPGSRVFNVELPKNSVTYTPRREPIYGISTIRRPPPTCRPPPPPSQDSPLSLDSSGNSVEKEFDLIRTGTSPKRSTDDDKSRNSGNSGDNGRESGYGTAPNRSWNSPMIVHQQKRVSLRQSEDIIRRQTPLAVYAHRSNAHPMTYV
uniref:Uncharacterized protein n=1 Tax=Setaria digitata TaxID=48799 RepID=A0A915Q5T5_9BILA